MIVLISHQGGWVKLLDHSFNQLPVPRAPMQARHYLDVMYSALFCLSAFSFHDMNATATSRCSQRSAIRFRIPRMRA